MQARTFSSSVPSWVEMMERTSSSTLALSYKTKKGNQLQRPGPALDAKDSPRRRR